MTSLRSRLPLLLLAALPLAPSPVRACGPDFPNCYLTNSPEELTQLPALSFEQELLRLMPKGLPAERKPHQEAPKLMEDEISELHASLLASGVAEARATELCKAYKRLEPPAEAAAEFQLYALGAKAWHAGKPEEAMKAWETLLALPAKERHFRSVWAWYMLGRALESTKPAEARKAYQETRACTASGCADSANLALASFGREALTWLREERYREAMNLYLCAFAMGDRSAAQSLQVCLSRIFRGADPAGLDEAVEGHPAPKGPAPASDCTLHALAREPALRALVTSWFASRGGPDMYWSRQDKERFLRWLACLPQAENLSPAEAERWAWACYQNGRFDEARQLVEKAAPGAPAAEWVRSMLLLRAGFTDESVLHLSAAAKGFALDPGLGEAPKDSPYLRSEQQPLGDEARLQLQGLRGVLDLHREHYTEALRLFLENEHWSDAAYVAERVLDLNELKAFVDSECPAPDQSGNKSLADAHENLRHLLARRLVRQARFDEALPYFPSLYRKKYATYLTMVRRAHDTKLDAPTRAEAFWQAAKALRSEGMEIQGTELAPDFQIYGGCFQWPEIPRIQDAARAREAAEQGRSVPVTSPFAPGTDECERLGRERVPTERFHYRLRAAELALLGSSLLPNDDPNTADMLHEAGRWLAPRWPAEANVYYKLLLVRCPNTELARAAGEHHWFLPAQ